MAWLREPLDGPRTLDYYAGGPLTVGSNTWNWYIDQPCEVKGIGIYSQGASAGAGNNTINILKNSTVIATATLASAATGDWTIVPPTAANLSLVPGDILRLDVAAVSATSGPALTSACIELSRT